MTEKFVRSVAEKFGLVVEKRITTGNDRRHFATFEISGPKEKVYQAWTTAIISQVRSWDFDSLRTVQNVDRHDQGEPYILLDSVWCDLDDKEAKPK